MNLVPSKDFKSHISTADADTLASNALPSLPDTLRQQQGAVPIATQVNDRHPLESRIRNWDQTQQNRQLEQYREIFGIAEPLKRVMDLKLVEQADFNPLHAGKNTTTTSLHRDVLLNKECNVDWEDVYQGGLQNNMIGNDVHTMIEKKLGI
ncbi:hypothetical protein TPHA_0I01680 [Tetrapisispora phaffii CBS 4417]|uniref:Proteasome maturation factor UMP1 n=1 Tax=Tetrapisispora phaffii (strain ATCC 24235 / CBS 4417 / NBRC 1672 / NRRL Y-8282 / UCD 70-5) TaxID=1071381 RepID=G8BXP4_TETPH|nr:hypothetical protein TPHA_0I01680 [Tetrapisispora phaffii CBS 4417]CCE64672.1 hypothetical protein TPHA_0I01680 [Tetrapisispora phaffii CBS 4417]